jgi:hypothetical protein
MPVFPFVPCAIDLATFAFMYISLGNVDVPSLWELHICTRKRNVRDHVLNIWTPEPDAGPAGDLVLWFTIFVIYLYISTGWEAALEHI